MVRPLLAGCWCDAAELGEGGFAVDAVRVVAGGDEELTGDLDADAGQLEELWRGVLDERFDLFVEGLDPVVECLPALREVAQRRLRPGDQHPFRLGGEGEQLAGFGAQAKATIHERSLG